MNFAQFQAFLNDTSLFVYDSDGLCLCMCVVVV